MSDDAKLKTVMNEYAAALHAMQSGVRQELANELPELPDAVARLLKHLRVGVNSAMVETSVVQSFLIKRGLVTEAEYMEALRDGMRAEAKSYEDRLSALLGIKVTLG